MDEHEFIVSPRSRKELREIAGLVRQVCGCREAKVDIVKLVEIDLARLDEGFVLHLPEREDMGDIEGLTNPIEKWIYIRADVYDGACRGRGRDRMTIAHEIGHYLLHRQADFPRIAKGAEIPVFRRSEWQANTFAGELLIGVQHIQGCSDAQHIVDRFGVSFEAANVQLQVLRKEQLIIGGEVTMNTK